MVAVLEDAQRLGFLGPGPVIDHIEHALGFVDAVGPATQGPLLDLGSGAGIPGLVLARYWPASRWTLLDAGARRTAFLESAVRTLGLDDRIQVVTGRAEEIGRQRDHRGGYRGVVARSFSRPAVVAECAAPLLAVEGWLVVSDPPSGGGRWPDRELADLGLRVVRRKTDAPRLTVLCQTRECPARYPRRTGIPGKRPLW